MDSETLGVALRRLRTTRSKTQKEVADKMDISEELVGQYERDKKLPRPARIDDFADALNLSFEERAYLYGLRSRTRKTPFPTLTDREINLCVKRLEEFLIQSRIPVIIIKQDHRIYGANSQAVELIGLDLGIAQQAIGNHISLFDILFNDQFALRHNIKNFRAIALDLIRDFLSTNALCLHEIHQQYPKC